MSERSEKTLGGYCGGVPPLPIPNREVKPACADGTAMQCGRVGGCLLYFRSSESNDFGDLFLCPYPGMAFSGGAAVSAAPLDSGKSRVSPGNYIAKINGVHREVMCWHFLSTTHAGCNTRELIPLWHLLGRLPLASRLAVAHGEVHR